MQNTIVDLYIALGQYLLGNEFKEFLENLDIKPLEHVDVFKTQPVREASEISYKHPAVFIELPESQVIEMGDIVTAERVSIHFHIESRDWGSTAMNSHNRPHSLEPLQLIEEVRFWLLQWNPIPNFSRLEYMGRRLDKTGNNHPVNILRFSIVYNRRRKC